MDDFLQSFSQIYVLAYNNELQKFDAKNKTITNISEAKHDHDAVNLITLKNYIFKNIQTELETIKNDIIRLYGILKFTDINSLYFSNLDINEDLKEKIINFKQNLDNIKLDIYEFTKKYTEIEKKLTNIQFKNIILENQIEELQLNVDNIYQNKNNELLKFEESGDKVAEKIPSEFKSNDSNKSEKLIIKELYNNFTEEFSIYKNNMKLTIDKLNVDINLINDKISDFFNNVIINKELEKLKIQLDNNNKSIETIKNDIDIISNHMYDNSLYYIKILTDINIINFTITNFDDSNTIKEFLNTSIYENVELVKIKYLIEYYNNNDQKITNIKDNLPIILTIENKEIAINKTITCLKQKINLKNKVLQKIILNNNILNKDISYYYLSLNLIFKITV